MPKPQRRTPGPISKLFCLLHSAHRLPRLGMARCFADGVHSLFVVHFQCQSSSTYFWRPFFMVLGCLHRATPQCTADGVADSVGASKSPLCDSLFLATEVRFDLNKKLKKFKRCYGCTHLDSAASYIQRSGWLELRGKKQSSSQLQLRFTGRLHPLSLHNATVWEQPLRALCPEICTQSQGKLTFPIFLINAKRSSPASFTRAAHQCHLSEGQLHYGNLQMLGDKNSQTCSFQCSGPVSLYTHRRQQEMQKSPGQSAVE